MNSHLALGKPGFCVANLRNSLLLRAIRRLESVFSEHNLLRPELIRGSLNYRPGNRPDFDRFDTGLFQDTRNLIHR